MLSASFMNLERNIERDLGKNIQEKQLPNTNCSSSSNSNRFIGNNKNMGLLEILCMKTEANSYELSQGSVSSTEFSRQPTCEEWQDISHKSPKYFPKDKSDNLNDEQTHNSDKYYKIPYRTSCMFDPVQTSTSPPGGGFIYNLKRRIEKE